MAFKYTAVTTRPSNSVAWFKDAQPAAYAEIVAWWQAQPGFQSGSWAVNPSNANEFISEHTWANRADWEAAAIASLDQANTKLFQRHVITNSLTVNKTLANI